MLQRFETCPDWGAGRNSPPGGLSHRGLLHPPSLLEQVQCLRVWKLSAGKSQSVSERRALYDFIRPFVVSGKFHPHGQVRSVFQQQVCHCQAPIVELGDCVKDRRLPAYTGLIHQCTRVHCRTAIQEKPGCVNTAVLRRHMQERRAL
jgi:hypothetical protein